MARPFGKMQVVQLQRERYVQVASAVLTGLAGLTALAWWLAGDPTATFVVSTPDMDDPRGLKAKMVAERTPVGIGQFFDRFQGVATDIPGRWPNFRGGGLNNIVADRTPLADSWPESGPPVLWSIELGEGHAGAAVANGRVYVMDYVEADKRDALRCFSLADGHEIWRRSYEVPVKRNHGMSRTIPAVTDKYVVTLGPMCHVMCVRAMFGDLLWGIDLEGTYGTTVPGWYAGQCPIIEDGLAILAPAGSNVLMMAVSCETGETVWETPNPMKWNMSHSSISPMTLNGKKMYVYVAVGGVCGVAAEGENAGSILWSATDWTPSVVAPSPVVLGDGRIFCAAGYGFGSAMFRVTESGGTYRVETLYAHKPRDGLSCEQHTPLYYKDHLFAVMPKDGAALRNQLVCWDPAGSMVWSSGKDNRFGLGPFVIADGRFFILDDEGVLTMAETSVKEYRRMAQARVLEGHDSWAPPAIVSGRMLVRDSMRMVCLDLR